MTSNFLEIYFYMVDVKIKECRNLYNLHELEGKILDDYIREKGVSYLKSQKESLIKELDKLRDLINNIKEELP